VFFVDRGLITSETQKHLNTSFSPNRRRAQTNDNKMTKQNDKAIHEEASFKVKAGLAQMLKGKK
jgi:hypothetical protein